MKTEYLGDIRGKQDDLVKAVEQVLSKSIITLRGSYRIQGSILDEEEGDILHWLRTDNFDGGDIFVYEQPNTIDKMESCEETKYYIYSMVHVRCLKCFYQPDNLDMKCFYCPECGSKLERVI